VENRIDHTNVMRGRICLITWSNSEIGMETAIKLAKMGATIVMVVIESEARKLGQNSEADRK